MPDSELPVGLAPSPRHSRRALGFIEVVPTKLFHHQASTRISSKCHRVASRSSKLRVRLGCVRHSSQAFPSDDIRSVYRRDTSPEVIVAWPMGGEQVLYLF